MLRRCYDLRYLRNRKSNIVWEEGEGEGGGCFPDARKLNSTVKSFNTIVAHRSFAELDHALRLLVNCFFHRAGLWDSVRSGYGCGQQHCLTIRSVERSSETESHDTH